MTVCVSVHALGVLTASQFWISAVSVLVEHAKAIHAGFPAALFS